MTRLYAVLTSAVLYTISFPVALYSPNLIPPALSGVVIWFAFVPLLLTLRTATPLDNLRFGYLFGILAHGGTFFWAIIAMQKYGGLSPWVSVSIYILMVLVLAPFPAIALYGAAKLRTKLPFWLTGTLLLTLTEWSRLYVPMGGFPWGTPAYALSGFLPLIQSADLVGTTGLNLLLISTNFVLAETWLRWQRREPLPKVALGSIALLIITSLFYGLYRLNDESLATGKERIRVALLQGNVSQELKWDPEERDQILVDYKKLTRRAGRSKPDLVVWPEAALPFTLPHDLKSLPMLSGFLGNADLVTGAPSALLEGEKATFFNSAFVFSPRGKIRLRYDKQHLVPFGEYVPLSTYLPMEWIVPPVAGNFSAGSTPQLARLGEHAYGILICYEVLFPDLALDMVRKGAHFLINITNDAWFDQTSGPYQHVRFGIFRAIETRRPILRSANTGITTWFDPHGRTHFPTRLFSRGFILADFSPSTNLTFYVRFPHLIPIAVWLFLILSLIWAWRKSVKKTADH